VPFSHPSLLYVFFLSFSSLHDPPKKRYGGGVLSTAAARLSVRRRPAAARLLGADVDRLLSRRRDVLLWSRLARCEVSFGM